MSVSIEPRDDAVDDPAIEAREPAEHGPEPDENERREQPGAERSPRAVDEPGENVAPLLIGSEGVARRRPRWGHAWGSVVRRPLARSEGDQRRIERPVPWPFAGAEPRAILAFECRGMHDVRKEVGVAVDVAGDGEVARKEIREHGDERDGRHRKPREAGEPSAFHSRVPPARASMMSRTRGSSAPAATSVTMRPIMATTESSSRIVVSHGASCASTARSVS